MSKHIQDLKNKSVKELEKEVLTVKTEIARMQLSSKASPQKNTNLILSKRKYIAQLLTVIQDKKEQGTAKKVTKDSKNI